MRLPKILPAIGAVLALAATLIAGAAEAAGSVRVEWLRGDHVYAAETITSTGSSVASSAAPSFNGAQGRVRLTAVQGAVIVSCCSSSTPTATQANGVRLDLGHGAVTYAVEAGDKLAVIEATDQAPDVVTITAAPTVTASSVYASGNSVGGLLTFAGVGRASGGSGFIQAVTLNFKSAQTAATDFAFCNATPASTTLTDKTAVSVAVADFDKCRVVHITDCTSLGTPSVCSADNLALPFALPTGTSGYGFLVTRGTPTYSATSDVSVALRVIRN